MSLSPKGILAEWALLGHKKMMTRMQEHFKKKKNIRRVTMKRAYVLALLALTLFSRGADASPYIEKKLQEFHLQTTAKISEFVAKDVGRAWIVDKDNFPVIEGVTCYTLELWDESMRLPHWHPNASELGYVIAGEIEIILWRSPGETAVFTASAGSCWFIPQGALHCLNNIGEGRAKLLVAFGSDRPQDVDLPVAFNGIPVPVRDAYTSPHEELKKWEGVVNNPLVGKFTPDPLLRKKLLTGSPYKFDFSQVPPLFSNPEMGSVAWAIKDNWSILKNISVLRAQLKPGVARDPIWYPDAGTLYVVSQGKGEFHIILAGQKPEPIEVDLYDYVYVPVGILHTFINNSTEDFEVVAFFNKDNPLPEVSLITATSFFPKGLLQETMTQYGTKIRQGDPLKGLIDTPHSPYLLRLQPPL